MALPTTIAGVQVIAAARKCGGFLSSGGNVYIIFLDSTDASIVEAWKATDPTSSFSEQNSAGKPDLTNLVIAIAAYQAGDVIHIVTKEASTGRIAYHTFNMATDAWGTVNEQVTATTFVVTGETVDIVLRSDGDVIVIYNGAQDTVTMSNFNRVKYARRESASWTANVAVDNAGSVSWNAGTAILGASDRTHFAFIDDDSDDAYQRTLTSANSLEAFPAAFDATIQSTAARADIGPGTSYVSGGATKVRFPYNNATAVWQALCDSADAPTVTIDGASFSDGAGLSRLDGAYYPTAMAAHLTDLYAFWINASSPFGLFQDKNANGAGWGTDVTRFGGPVTRFFVTPFSFTRSGNYKIGFVIYDGTNVKYDELDLGSASSVGSSTGGTTVTAVGSSTAQGHGDSAGASIVTAVGGSIAVATGSVSGSSTATAFAAAQGAAVGSSTATADGRASTVGVGASSGSTVDTAVGSSTASAPGTAAGTAVASANAAFNSFRRAILNGLDSAQSEGTGWDALKASIPESAVVRTNDTTVTITLPALATYDITADETITATIPAAALTGGVPIVATPTIAVTAAAGAQSDGAAAGSSTVTAVGKADSLAAGVCAGLATAAAIGLAVALSLGSAAGTSTATGVGRSTVVSIGSAAGASTALATAAPQGAAAGTSTASSVGSSAASTVGASVGSSTVTAVGSSTASAIGSAAGTSTAAAVGQGQGAAAGISTATAVGQSTALATGSAAGDSTAIGINAAGNIGAAAGSSTASAVGSSNASGVGAAAGISGVTALGASASQGIAASAGTSTTTAVGAAASVSVGSAAGTSTAQGVNGAQNIGAADGSSTATAVGLSVARSAGAASGTATVTAVGAESMLGAAAGSSTATAIGKATSVAVGSATGTSTALATAPIIAVPPSPGEHGGGGRTFIAETGGFRLKKIVKKQGGSITTVFITAEGAGVKQTRDGALVIGLQGVSVESAGRKHTSDGALAVATLDVSAEGFSDDPELLLRMFADRFIVRRR